MTQAPTLETHDEAVTSLPLHMDARYRIWPDGPGGICFTLRPADEFEKIDLDTMLSRHAPVQVISTDYLKHILAALPKWVESDTLANAEHLVRTIIEADPTAMKDLDSDDMAAGLELINAAVRLVPECAEMNAQQVRRSNLRSMFALMRVIEAAEKPLPGGAMQALPIERDGPTGLLTRKCYSNLLAELSRDGAIRLHLAATSLVFLGKAPAKNFDGPSSLSSAATQTTSPKASSGGRGSRSTVKSTARTRGSSSPRKKPR